MVNIIVPWFSDQREQISPDTRLRDLMNRLPEPDDAANTSMPPDSLGTSEIDHAILHDSLTAERKKLSKAYGLLVSLGLVGAHRAYLNDMAGFKKCRRIFMLPGSFIALLLLCHVLPFVDYTLANYIAHHVILRLMYQAWAVLALIGLLALVIMVLFDAIKLPAMVSRYNATIDRQIATKKMMANIPPR